MRAMPVLSLALLSLLNPLAAAENALRVVPMETTPCPDHIDLTIAFPGPGSVVTESPVRAQLQLAGFPLGTNTDSPRESEIRNNNTGQVVRVIIDDRPPIELNETKAINNAFDDHEVYYEQTLDFDLKDLSPGKHIMRTFAVFSYGESAKDSKSFIADTFYYKNKNSGLSVNLNKPYLTYNEPRGKFSAEKPVLLDFFICNCDLSSDGYKVKLTIDESSKRLLTQWTPYYIHGLGRGSHKIRLQLLDSHNDVVDGPFNDVEQTIVIN